jgi:nitrogenase molybdenum-iron protein alpha chain
MFGRGVNRESQPHTYYGDAGSFCEMENKFRQGCMQNVNRSFMQAQQCPLVTAVRVMQSLRNSVIIAHSPLGCAGGMAMENGNIKLYDTMSGNPQQNSRIISTNLDENDIIMGGEDKLRQAIKEAIRRYQPEVITLMSSCASGIIGDDIEAIAAELQAQTDAVIIPVFCEGFRSKIPITGSDVSFFALEKYIFKGLSAQRQDNLINVISLPTSGAKDEAHLSEMLAVLGLEANFLPFTATLAGIRKMVSARLSTSICSVYGEELLQYLDKEYGIPYTRFVMPMGTEETDLWLRNIAALVGKEAEAEAWIAEQRAFYLPKIKLLRERIQGRRVFISTNLMRSISNTALARDFGLEVVGLQTALYNEFLHAELNRLSDMVGPETLITFNGAQAYEQANLIRKLDVDIMIGMGVDQARRQGVPAAFQVDRTQVTFGYKGLLALATKFANALENQNFVKKLAAHKKLPYKEAWYRENAFKYLVSESE